MTPATELNSTRRRAWSAGLVAALLLSASTSALRAETSNNELAKEIAELKAQIRAMRGAIAETRTESRRTTAKVRAVAERGPAPGYVLPPPSAPAIPVGATPAFVTADKKLQFGAITITPGGFLAGESVYRSRSLQADMISPFGAIPFNNNVLGHTNEFRFSARQTRLALLVEAPITPTFLAAGYVEFDFSGAAPTANENQTNSYTPRIRNLYATLDETNYGMHVLAGQNWSLVTLNSKGITPRNEVTPNVIDSAQTVGSLYARQPQIRLTKDFDKKLWVALSVEQSQITNTCAQPGNPAAYASNLSQQAGVGFNATCSVTGAGGGFVGLQQSGPFYSLDHIPDVIGKVAYEAKLGVRDIHLEATGLYTNLYDRVAYSNAAGAVTGNANKNTNGYGVGGGIIAAVIPKRLDFQLNGMYGRGINRYGPGGLPDATINSDGSLRAIQGYIGLAGLTLHATPSIDIYGYAGVEGEVRTYTRTNAAGTAFAGIGSPATNNSGCYSENAIGGVAPVCNGSTRRLFEVTGGFWDKLYKGSFGEVRVGANYAYVNRQLFNAPGIANQPKTSENIVMTSFRYYPFQ